MKKLLALLMAFCLVFSLCGCDFAKDIADSAINEKAKAKTFEFDGVSIKLTTDFLRMDFVSEDYDFVVGNEELTIMGLEMDFEDSEVAALSVSEFAEFFRSNMTESDPTEVEETNSIPSIQYRKTTDDGEELTPAVMFYKGDDCFWAICFAADTDDFDELYDDILKYAKSVKVD